MWNIADAGTQATGAQAQMGNKQFVLHPTKVTPEAEAIVG